MKPIKISIKGFNSFIEEQSIDFEKLMSRGMFGIFGPTGSGKSTVLDAITFALYGKIARESSSHSQYININTDSAIVVFEFEVETNCRERYKIIREIKRNKKGSTNTTQCKIIKMGAEEEVLGEKERETTEEIKKIIGLEYNDFIKTVVLPQGSFNEFIKLEGKERREILERLFSLQKYGKLLEDKIGNRAKQVDNQLKVLEGEIKAYGDVDAKMIETQEKEIKQSEAIYEELKEKKLKSDKDFGVIKTIFEMQGKLAELEEELKQELAKKEEFDKLEQEIKNSQKAALITPLILDYDELIRTGKKVREGCDKIEEEHKQKTKEYQSVKEDFDQIEKRKSTDYVERLKKQTKLQSLISVFENYQKSTANSKILKDETAQLEDRKIVLFQKNIEYDKQLKELDNKIKTANTFLKDNKIDINYKNNITKAIYLSKQISDFSINCSSLEEDKKIYLEQVKSFSNKISELKNKRESLEKQLSADNIKLADLQGDERTTPEYIINLKNKYSEDLQNLEKYNRINEKIEITTISLEKNDIKLKEISKEHLDIKNKLEKIQAEYNQKLVESTINELKHSLCDGDECPICTNKISKNKISMSKTVGADELKLEIEMLIPKERELSNDILLLNQNKNVLVDELNSLNFEIEEFLGFKDLTSEQIKEDFLQKEQESKDLILKIENIQRIIQSNEKEKIDLDNNLAILEIKIQSAQENIAKNDENLKKATTEKNKLEIELENLGFDNNADLASLLEKIEKLEKQLEEQNILKDNLTDKKGKIENEFKDLQSDIQKNEIDLRTNNEKLKTQISLEEQLKSELVANLGDVKDPSAEFNNISVEIEKIDNQYLSLQKEEKRLYEINNTLKTDLESSKRNLDSLREQAKSKQNSIYAAIENNGIYNINSYEGETKLKKLKELKDLILSWEMSIDLIAEKESLLAEHNKKINEKQGAISNVKNFIGENNYSEEEYKNAELENKELEQKLDEISKKFQAEKIKFEQNKEKIAKYGELLQRISDIENKQSILKELKSVVGAKKFVEFIAMKQLKYVTMQATQRLNEITNGAYSLEVDDEGIFKIRDNKNGGALRTVKTLSGGETFVVSLSLALALSAQIQLKGVSPLELFFLDEGFGTLDDDLLEVVVDSLEKIQNERLNVGVISHIEQLKQRIPVKLVVSPAKSGEGGSKVKIEYS